MAIEKKMNEKCCYLFLDTYSSIVKLIGPIDILINNAGIMDDNEVDLMIDINLVMIWANFQTIHWDAILCND